jgi:hypothetical protein
MPDYIDEVWNMERLSGIVVLRIPLEEYLFAFSFGMYWAGVYEHVTWQRPADAPILTKFSYEHRTH